MCNPPFYATHSELLLSAAIKRRPPNTACTGSANEMIYPGGEVAFVTRMILESVKLKDRVQWYTSMLGKYSSVDVVVEKLRGVGVGNYAVMEFVQGSKTKRWGVAWSFEGRRPRMKTARGIPSLPKGLLPFPSEYLIIVSMSLVHKQDHAYILVDQRHRSTTPRIQT
jgi:23S rRNA (adenine1618-N6)-methyltransferase